MVRSKFSRWGILVLVLAPSLALAKDLPRQFTLGKYLPEDCWMCVHGVDNPESAWIYERWGEVFEALKASGIDKDIKGLIVSLLDEQGKAKFESGLTKVLELAGGVKWSDMMHYEMAFAERFGVGLPGYEYILLMRGKPETADANAQGLVAILKEIAALDARLAIKQTTVDGVTVWTLPITEKAEFGMDFGILQKGDIIGFIMGKKSLTSVPAMLAGKSTEKPIVDSARFKEALGQIPTPEDSVTFFDLRGFIGGLDKMFEAAFANAKEDEAKQVKQIMKSLVTMGDFIDYVVTSMETDGHRTLTHHVTKLLPNYGNSPVGASIYDRKPFEKFDKYIPADATGFTVDTFLDLEGLYKAAIDFVEKEVPDGKKHIEEFKAGLAQVGFDPQRDVFSWWSGEMMSVTLPPVVVTPMSSSDSVLFIRVKDSKLASEKVTAALGFVAAMMQGAGQALTTKPAEGCGEGFSEIVFAPIAMFAKPVIGVKDEWLMLSSSAGAVTKCLDVASGKSPSIMSNERFKKEGLIPQGPVLSVSFTDTSKLGQEMAAILGPLSFGIGMASASIPSNDPEARKVKEVMQKGAGIMMKLGPVLQKIDFFSSDSMMSTRDGLAIRSETVTTYKPEAITKSKTASSDTAGK